ncbi:MAG: sugar-binding protein, partial [Planctomycetota bacterium]|nr:sugar-binding protein [Planctomycetota bacterium]
GLSGPKSWITAKLLWDLDENVDALLQDFCERCFGEAAGPMREFYDLWETAWNTQPKSGSQGYAYIWGPSISVIAPPGVMDKARECLSRALLQAKSDKARQRIEQIRKTLRVTEYCSFRESVYASLRIDEHLTPRGFAELVCNLNQMCYTTQALSHYMAEKIRGDNMTFRNGDVYTGHMDSYYCLIASGLASALARREVAKTRPASQDALTGALLKRLDGLASVVTESAEKDPLTQGLAWQPFSRRVRTYLGATTLVPRAKKAPTIDGNIGKDEWGGMPLLTGFKVFDGRGKRRTLDKDAEFQTEVRLGYDDAALYVAYACREKNLADLVSGRDRRDSDVWHDDSADFTILAAGTERKEDFNHYIVNPDGVFYDSKGSANWQGKPVIRTGRDTDSNTWTVEAAIPWSDFGRKPVSGEVWRAQFARINMEGSKDHLSCWAPTSQGFNNADYLGVLLFE